jgi:hypothetical protein
MDLRGRGSRPFAPVFFEVRAEVRAVGAVRLNRLGLCGREPRGMPFRNNGQLKFAATGNPSDKFLILWPDVLANDYSGEKTWIESHNSRGIEPVHHPNLLFFAPPPSLVKEEFRTDFRIGDVERDFVSVSHVER